jgi:hypothetical protein
LWYANCNLRHGTEVIALSHLAWRARAVAESAFMGMSHLDSPALILLKRRDRKVPVCGKNMQVALWAAALVDAVLRRGQVIPLPTARTGGLVRTRINDPALSRFLRDIYGNEPGTVAEAIMALRKLDPARAAWLLRLLRRRAELQDLGRDVHAELTGEDFGQAGAAG